MTKQREIGNEGERYATAYLTKKGHRVLEQNWRFSRAEIDIISMDGEVLVFTEVKTRSYDYYGKPEEFVTEHKQRLMVDAAQAYMDQADHQWEIRFDIISILLNPDGTFTLKHFEDGFFPGIR
jgi:putative endonuclease